MCVISKGAYFKMCWHAHFMCKKMNYLNTLLYFKKQVATYHAQFDLQNFLSIKIDNLLQNIETETYVKGCFAYRSTRILKFK